MYHTHSEVVQHILLEYFKQIYLLEGIYEEAVDLVLEMMDHQFTMLLQ